MDTEQLRNRILSHAKTVETQWGPQYVPCQCARCINDRAERAYKLQEKLYGAGSKYLPQRNTSP